MSRTNFDKMVLKYKPLNDYVKTDLYKYTYSNLHQRGFTNIDYCLSNYYMEQIGVITSTPSNVISASNNNITNDAPASNNIASSNVLPNIPIITPILSNIVIPIIKPKDKDK